MEIIYRAFDGKEFDNEADCCYHESVLCDSIIMLDRMGQPTQKTDHAYILWLRDEASNLAFHAMAERQGDDQVSSITKGEDYGLFFWDEGLEEYRYADDDMIKGLMIAKRMIDERKDV